MAIPMRFVRHILLIFTAMVVVSTVSLAYQRRQPSTAMWMVFSRADEFTYSSGSGQLFRVAPDGSHLRSLSEDTVYYTWQFGWSPDARWIVYGADPCAAGCYEVYSVNVMSGERIILQEWPAIRGRYTHLKPFWSADGQWIYFWQEIERLQILYRIRPDRTDAMPVADNAFDAALSPDGTQLAFLQAENPRLSAELYVARPDGSHPQRIAEV